MKSLYQSFVHSQFAQGFKTSMRPNWLYSFRLDEIPYFIAWPLVYLLGYTRITPNQVALISFLCGVGFLAGLYRGMLATYPIFLFLLLLARIILDCVDGQLARFTRQASNLGALYDLISDFVFGIALFACLGYFLITFEHTDPNLVIPVIAMAFCCFLISSTVFSYISSLERSSDLYPAEVRRRFVAPLVNDRPGSGAYGVKLAVLNACFRYTWRLVSFVSFLLVLNPEKSELHASALRMIAPLEFGMHLVVLAVMILLHVSLVYFLIFEITAFCILLLLLLYHYRG